MEDLSGLLDDRRAWEVEGGAQGLTCWPVNRTMVRFVGVAWTLAMAVRGGEAIGRPALAGFRRCGSCGNRQAGRC